MNPHAGMVCLSQLKAPLKRRAWAFIQANRPELLAELSNPQSNLQQLATRFNATLWVPIADTGLTSEDLRASALASQGTGAS